jgi:hypothetical protein
MQPGATYQAATNCHFNVYSRNLGNYLDKVIIIVSVGIYQKTCNEVDTPAQRATKHHQNAQRSRAMEHYTPNVLLSHLFLTLQYFHNQKFNTHEQWSIE